MLEYDSISTLKDDIIIMKNEIKKLTAVTFSALGILACSSASFCEGSSVGCFMHNKRQRKLKRDIPGIMGWLYSLETMHNRKKRI